jgi:hypothetical protein
LPAVNVLLFFLRDHPDATRELVRTGDETVPLGGIVDLISRWGDFPLVLDFDVLERLGAEPLGEALLSGYLPVVDSEKWGRQVAAAEPDYDDGGAEWVTFVKHPADPRGVSLPGEAGGPMRVSVFTRVGDSVRRVSIDYERPGPPTSLSISLAAGCSLPDWGECSSSECSGDCELRRRRDDNDGLVCRCPSS